MHSVDVTVGPLEIRRSFVFCERRKKKERITRRGIVSSVWENVLICTDPVSIARSHPANLDSSTTYSNEAELAFCIPLSIRPLPSSTSVTVPRKNPTRGSRFGRFARITETLFDTCTNSSCVRRLYLSRLLPPPPILTIKRFPLSTAALFPSFLVPIAASCNSFSSRRCNPFK